MEELKRLREEKGWSQTKLAQESGVDRATINQVEGGRRSPTISTLEILAAALEVEVADFFPKAQAPLPLDENERGFSAWTATLEHYKSLRDPIADFDELGTLERQRIFEESLRLLQDLRGAYDPTHLQLALLHDVLYQAVLRMLGVYELEQERSDDDADLVDIEMYRARLRQSA